MHNNVRFNHLQIIVIFVKFSNHLEVSSKYITTLSNIVIL